MRLELLQLMLYMQGKISPVVVQVNCFTFLRIGQNVHLKFVQTFDLLEVLLGVSVKEAEAFTGLE